MKMKTTTSLIYLDVRMLTAFFVSSLSSAPAEPAPVRFVFLYYLFIFPIHFPDKLANISRCIKNNKCPENESNSFFFGRMCFAFSSFLSKRLLIHPFRFSTVRNALYHMKQKTNGKL